MTRLLPLCVLLFVNPALTYGGADGFKETLSAIAQESAIKTLKDKQFNFKSSDFTGTFQAVEPQKTLKIKVQNFTLADDIFKIKVQINGLFKLSGRYSKEGKSTNVEADLILDIIPTAERLSGVENLPNLIVEGPLSQASGQEITHGSQGVQNGPHGRSMGPDQGRNTGGRPQARLCAHRPA